VPIWKKEHFADGEVWVEGEWDRSASIAESSAQSIAQSMAQSG
jgi:molybdopterin synthase catalytic subunit